MIYAVFQSTNKKVNQVLFKKWNETKLTVKQDIITSAGTLSNWGRDCYIQKIGEKHNEVFPDNPYKEL